MATYALIALGTNLGDRRGHLDAAVAALGATAGVSVRKVSAYHETAPAGGPGGQGAFLNAAAVVRTTLDPHGLLRALQAIEADRGRVREVRWGARTLDLDLILYGKQHIETAELTVPHPRMAVRRFVLAPAAEVAPGMLDPGTHRTLADLLANLDRRPGLIAVVGPPGPGTRGLIGRLSEGLGAETLEGLRSGGDELLVAAPPPGPSPSFESQFREAVAALDARRWPPDRAGGGWVVADFWVDQFLVSGLLRFGSSTCHLLPFRDAFVRSRPGLRAPTFVAFWDPPEDTWSRHIGGTEPVAPAEAAWHRRGVASLVASWSRLRGAYRDTLSHALRRDPVLVLPHAEPAEAAADVLAACAASRDGTGARTTPP